ncbi:MAG: hypothetical protein U0973_03850 [Xanthomonadaceae bacterium]|nr:hypothetical protein [Xanthomonadaceae bacterium]
MSPNHNQPDFVEPRRRAQLQARRTAWVLGAVALAVYLGFLASGVFGQ